MLNKYAFWAILVLALTVLASRFWFAKRYAS